MIDISDQQYGTFQSEKRAYQTAEELALNDVDQRNTLLAISPILKAEKGHTISPW